MIMQKTFAIVKPDGVRKGLIGKVIDRISTNDIKVSALRMATLSRAEAEGFYGVHRERPFFGELVEFMTSGPVALMVLEGEEVIPRWRKLMGATNPADAEEGTLRRDFADSIGENVVHGSDAEDTANFEINWFFRESELV